MSAASVSAQTPMSSMAPPRIANCTSPTSSPTCGKQRCSFVVTRCPPRCSSVGRAFDPRRGGESRCRFQLIRVSVRGTPEWDGLRPVVAAVWQEQLLLVEAGWVRQAMSAFDWLWWEFARIKFFQIAQYDSRGQDRTVELMPAQQTLFIVQFDCYSYAMWRDTNMRAIMKHKTNDIFMFSLAPTVLFRFVSYVPRYVPFHPVSSRLLSIHRSFSLSHLSTCSRTEFTVTLAAARRFSFRIRIMWHWCYHFTFQQLR